jgi:hypothetical protein
MFDNLRDSGSNFYEEEPNDLFKEPEAKSSGRSKRRKSSGRFLGLSGQQRFILSFMFFLMVCVGGTFVMFLLGKMSLF